MQFDSQKLFVHVAYDSKEIGSSTETGHVDARYDTQKDKHRLEIYYYMARLECCSSPISNRCT